MERFISNAVVLVFANGNLQSEQLLSASLSRCVGTDEYAPVLIRYQKRYFRQQWWANCAPRIHCDGFRMFLENDLRMLKINNGPPTTFWGVFSKLETQEKEAWEEEVKFRQVLYLGNMGVRRNFSKGGKIRHFAYPFQVADDAMQMNVHKTL